MNNRLTILLLALSLLGAALGWQFLASNHHPSTSSGGAELATADYPPVVTEPPFVMTDVPASGEKEDDAEALARSVSEMGVTELTSRLSAISLEDLRGNLGRLLVRRWADIDPLAAGRWVTQLGDAEAGQELATALALAWSGRDLSGALDWAYSLPAGDVQNRVVSELGIELARIDPVASMRLAVELPASSSRDGILMHALRQWAGQDVEMSQTWALQLSPGSFREQALAAVATVMADQEGERAARFAAEQLMPGLEQDRAVVGIIQRWAQLDYDRAASWAASFPDTALRENAIAVLVGFAPGNLP